MTERKRRPPSAFPVDKPNVRVAGPEKRRDRPETATADAKPATTVITPAPEDDVPPAVAVAERAAKAPSRSSAWGRLFFAGLGGLVTLAIGLAVDQLIRDLFARTDWLGWLGVALAAMVALASIVIAAKELAGLMRLRQIAGLRERAAAAAEADDRKLARSVVGDVAALYGGRPETAHGRAILADHLDEIIDGRDLIRLAERELLGGFDRTARRMVADSAKRVSIVTAVSPRALVDVLFVLAETLRLIRRLSRLYGGRPGAIGLMPLSRSVLSHLAVTGGIAIGDSVLQQLIGHGLAAKLSARLGEGVVNGLLTARVGIAAIDVCRPLPFVDTNGPRITDFAGEIAKIGEAAPDKDNRAAIDRLMR